MARINLLPWREAQRKDQQRKLVSVTAFAAALTGVAVFYAHIHVNGMIEYQQRRNHFLENEIKILDNQIKEIKKLESTKQALLDRMSVIQDLQATRPEIVHLFDELPRTLPDGTYLTALKQSSNKLIVEGKAESNARVSAYMRSINASPWLGNSDLDVIETREDKTTRVSDFTLQAQQAKPGGEDGAGKDADGKEG